MFHWYLPGSSTPVRPARVSSVSLVSSVDRLLLSDLPESVVFHWYLPGSSTPVLSTAVSSAAVSALRLVCLPIY